MSVVLDKPSVVEQWLDGAGKILEVRSNAPVEKLLALVDVTVMRDDPTFGLEALDLHAWTIPHGVAISVVYCEGPEDLEAVIDAVAASLQAAEVDARIGLLKRDRTVWPNGENDGFSAAMTIVGDPYWDAPNDPGERRLTQRMWDPDLQARAEMIEQAVRWCHVEGGELWLTAEVTSFKIPRSKAVSLLRRIVNAGTECSIIAARDVGLVRRVEFGDNGYVIYELGGTKQPDWQTCVDELASVLIDVHTLITWGFILRRPKGALGIGPATSRVVHDVLWLPYEDRVAGFGRCQDPRRYPALTLDVYGVQVLGPGHDVAAVGGEWEVRDLSEGHQMVSSLDPAAWYAQSPSLETLLSARESFGSLVDPIWDPLEN